MNWFPSYEKVLAAFALAAALVTGGWVRCHAPQPISVTSSLRNHPTPYVATVEETEETKNRGWTRPAAQKRGPEWIYEMFTPPEIYYDGRSQEFSVKPPVTSGPEIETAPEPALAPLEPFRLQLVGFVGGEGSYLGTFENVATTEHILARSGRTLPELAVTIRDFQVKRVRREPDDSMPTSELIATAIVRDERTGDDVVLTNLERAYVRP